jgi:hypothetical protein
MNRSSAVNPTGRETDTLITFHTTHASLVCERRLLEDLPPVRLVATPRSISSECGFALLCSTRAPDEVEATLHAAALNWEAIYGVRHSGRQIEYVKFEPPYCFAEVKTEEMKNGKMGNRSSTFGGRAYQESGDMKMETNSQRENSERRSSDRRWRKADSQSANAGLKTGVPCAEKTE